MRKKKKNRNRILSGILSLIMVFSLFSGINGLSAQAAENMQAEKTLICGKEEHTHTEECYGQGSLICTLEETEGHQHDDSCYEKKQICELEESEGHIHTDACKDENGNYICGLEESEGHTHDESCYERGELTCGTEEAKGHTHAADCYEKTLMCDIEEHTHAEECYEEKPQTPSDAERNGETVAEVKAIFEAILADYLADRSEENTIANIVENMDEETLNACKEQTTAAMDAFDGLTTEECDAFIAENEALYQAIYMELAEALADRANNDIATYAEEVPHSHTGYGSDITFTNWKQSTSLPTTAGNYCLTADVSISDTWDVPAGTTSLCLNGHSITMTGNQTVITVGSGETLNLYDCGNTTCYFVEKTIEGSGTGAAVIWELTSNTTENALNGGVITGGKADAAAVANSDIGGGITNPGTLNFYGGNVVGNYVHHDDYSVYGGGIFNTGIFNMYGGTITGNCSYNIGTTPNRSTYGGGVYSGAGSVNIQSGMIQHNVTTRVNYTGTGVAYGGGVSVSEGIVSNSGTISNNTAGTYGGGVVNKATFQMSDGSIANNTANSYGGGIVNWGTFCMTAGSVTNNVATTYGGGIYNEGETVELGGSFEINGNTAGSGGNNLMLVEYYNNSTQSDYALNITSPLINTKPIGVSVWDYSGNNPVIEGADTDSNSNCDVDGGGWYVTTSVAGGVTVNKDKFVSEDNTRTLKSTSDGKVYLKLRPAGAYMITFDANGGIVTTTSADTGTDSKLTELPTPTREGYTFDGWYTAATDGTKIDENHVFPADTTVYAHWTQNKAKYTVGVTANPTAGGTVTGAGTYEDGTSVIVKATANSGYHFAGWKEGKTTVSTEAEYTFTISKNIELTAAFEQNKAKYTVGVTANPTEGGTNVI